MPNTDETQEVKEPQWYRDELDKHNDELKELRKFKRGAVMKDAGLDPTTGIGKAILKDIERGDFGEKLDADTLRTYATDEYGWQGAAPEPANQPAPEPSLTPEIVAGQNRLAQVREAGTPPQPTDAAARANELDASGDILGAIRQKVASQLQT